MTAVSGKSESVVTSRATSQMCSPYRAADPSTSVTYNFVTVDFSLYLRGGQSNPASCRHRAEARGARLIADTAMVAVDEVLADSSIDGMLQLPLVSRLVADIFAHIFLRCEHFRFRR
uniref:Uncharacterized protein n=1 Tax=Parascaris equorum TaxID=6256 RepID=A0A914S939_PAREQ